MLRVKRRHAWAVGSRPIQNINQEPGPHNAQAVAMMNDKMYNQKEGNRRTRKRGT